MRQIRLALCAVAAAGLFAGQVSADDKAAKMEEKPAVTAEKKEAVAIKTDASEAPEFLLFDKTAKMAPVKFPHKLHGEKVEGGCATCHEGKEPIFAQKKSAEGRKMADIYAGKACGACHDGKNANKKAFAAKSGCMKCHKK